MKLKFKTKNSFLFLGIFLINMALFAQSPSKKAEEIAQKVLVSMGGVENWNNVKYIQWNFGKRILYWNKWTGDVRVESPEDQLVVLVNINTNKGKAYENGILISDEKQTEKFLKKGKAWWINDSYWLTMPWKLTDPGVDLTYLKSENLPNGNKADVLQMTFENVGLTPNNKYFVYVDQTDGLVKQWSFFQNFYDETPRFTKAWDNYQLLEKVLLSFDRSKDAGGPKKVIVKQVFEEKLFTEL